MTINEPAAIARILAEYKNIAVVGLSSNPMRASYGVSRYMQQNGYHVIPVNPTETEVLGEKAYASLTEVPGPLEVVDIFRRSEDAGAIVDAAIALNAKAVWLQEGVVDQAAAQRALVAGLLVVMDRCILKEHSRWRR
jgi:uncharacterized protein